MRQNQILIFIMLLIGSNGYLFAQSDTIVINEDLQLIHLNDSVFVHVSFYTSEKFGRFSSNGMLVIRDGKGLLVDTPMDNTTTEILLSFLEDSLHVQVEKFIAGHFHKDCIGGLKAIHDHGAESIANYLTIEKCKELNLPVPKIGFTDSMSFNFHGEYVNCNFFGGGHSFDNIVVYLPKEKILFGGCLVKSINSRKLGNLSDAVVFEWPATIKKIQREIPDIKLIIPGHGSVGGPELLAKTYELAELANK